MRGATQHGTAMFHSRFTHSTTEARPMSPLRHAHGTPRRVAGEEPGTVRCRACWSWLRARSSARLSSLSRNAWIPALLRRPSDWGGVCCVARGFYFSIFYWLRHRYGRLSWFSSAFPPSPPPLSPCLEVDSHFFTWLLATAHACAGKKIVWRGSAWSMKYTPHWFCSALLVCCSRSPLFFCRRVAESVIVFVFGVCRHAAGIALRWLMSTETGGVSFRVAWLWWCSGRRCS